MKSMFEEIGGTYTQVGDFLLPNLYIESREEYHIGKYSRMRKRYLKEHRPILFSNLPLSGNLDQHLEEIDRSANEMFDLMIKQYAEREEVTEELKALDQMEWVRRMNNIRERVEESIIHELIDS